MSNAIYVLDIINSKVFKSNYADNIKTKKCFKNIFIAMFYYKEMERANLNRILKSKRSITHFQEKYSEKKIPVGLIIIF